MSDLRWPVPLDREPASRYFAGMATRPQSFAFVTVALLFAACGGGRPPAQVPAAAPSLAPVAPTLAQTSPASGNGNDSPPADTNSAAPADARARAVESKQAKGDLASLVDEATGLRQFAALVRESGVPYPTDPNAFIAVIPDEIFTENNARALANLRRNKTALRDVIECHMQVLRCTMKPGSGGMHVEATDRGMAFSFGGPLMWKTEDPRVLIVERLLTTEERRKGRD